MKYFGTVKTFDEANGRGLIKPEQGGDELRFDRSAISWDGKTSPKEGQRLSYDVSTDGRNAAVNLQTI